MFQKSIADRNKLRQFLPQNLQILFLNLKHYISKPETLTFIYFNDLAHFPFFLFIGALRTPEEEAGRCADLICGVTCHAS